MLRDSLLCLIALLLALPRARAQCTDGCLRCNKIDANSSTCEICDSPGFYVPFGVGLCLQIEIEGCEVPTVDRSESKCLRCAKDHIFDTTTDKCKRVADLVANCAAYDSSANCQMCDEGYYLDAKACTAVAADKLVQNCAAYETTDFACLSCKAGYYLNRASKLCDAIDKEQNCVAYSQNKCLACAAGYIKNDNYRLSLALDTAFMKQVVLAEVDGKADALLVSATLNDCKKTTVLHCAAFETFDKCSACEAGYFLTDGGAKCELLPQEPIKNCLAYSDATTCATCVNGAWKDTADCKASTVVEFCEAYSQVADACVRCKYGYYLDGAACKAREHTRASVQCQTLSPSADECQTCNPNFVLNTAKRGCVAAVANCYENAVDPNDDSVSCTQCLPGFGQNPGGLCQQQAVAHCKSHTQNAPTCAECDDDHYLTSQNTQCLPNTVQNCQEKSKTAPGCLKCNEHFYTDPNNSCSLQSVENCETFVDNENKCTKCLDGFFAENDDAKCTQYTLVNCKTPNPSANLCDMCEADYYKNDDATAADGVTKVGCARQNRDDCQGYVDNQNTCNKCSPGYWLDASQPGGTDCKKKSRPGCKTYTDPTSTVSTHDQCSVCDTGKYVDANGDCQDQDLDNCTTPTSNKDECTLCHNKYYLLAATKKCTAIADQNCVKSDGTTNACQVCNRGYYLGSGSCSALGSQNGVDANCTGNTNTVDDAVCTECADDSMRFFVSRFGVDVASASHITDTTVGSCLKFKADKDECELCKEGVGSSAANKICDTPDDTQPCLQKASAGIAELLSVAAKCNKCADKFYHGTFVDEAGGYTCAARTVKSLNCEPGHSTKTADTCDTCAKDSTFGKTDNFAICMDDGLTAATYATNCDVVDIEKPDSCLSCSKMETSGITGTNPQTCEATLPTNGSVFNIYKADRTLASLHTAATDQSTNCHADGYYGVDYHLNVSCAVCANGKQIKKLKLEDSGNNDNKKKINGQTFVASQKLGEKEVSGLKIVPFTNTPATDGGCLENLTALASKLFAGGPSSNHDKEIRYVDSGNTYANGGAAVHSYLDSDTSNANHPNNYFTTNNLTETLNPSTDSADPDYLSASDPPTTENIVLNYASGSPGKKYYITDYTPPNSTATYNNQPNYGNILQLDDDSIATISCKHGFKPTISEHPGTSTDTTPPAQVTSVFRYNVSDCDALSNEDLDTRYQGLGYGSESVIPLTALLQYDSCVQSSELFFFVGQIVTQTAAGNDPLGFIGSTLYNKELTESEGNQLCTPFVTNAGEKHEVVQNCQVHLSDSDVTADMLTTKTTFHCIACKPGYKPNYTDPAGVATSDGVRVFECLPIENCDRSNDANNTWMNMCQTCAPGHSWDHDKDALKLDLANCAANSLDHCLVIDKASSTSCIFCEPGYSLTATFECEPMHIANCTNYYYHSVEHLYDNNPVLAATDIDKLKSLADINAFLQWAVYGDKPQYTAGCRECKTAFKAAAGNGSSANNYCLGTQMHGTVVADCEYYAGSAAGVCVKCKGDKVVLVQTSSSTTTYTCEDRESSEINCISKSSAATNNTNCTKCVGFRPPVGGKCYGYNNCDEVETAGDFKCARCKPGYKPHSDGFDCVEADQTDQCQVYLKNGVCLKCKDGAKSPVTMLTTGAAIRVDCVDKYSDTASTVFTNMYQNNAFTIDTGADTPAKQFTTSLVYQPMGEFAYHDFMGSGVHPKVSVCIKKPVVSHCKTYDAGGFRKCTACEAGYKLDSTDHTCVDGTIADCVAYTTDKCTACHPDYFLESDSKCTKRSVTNCSEFDSESDHCTACHPDHYYVVDSSDSSYGLCHAYTVDHCDGFSATANKCTACVPRVRYLTSGGECHLFTKRYCKDFSTSSDACTSCNADRWLSSATDECEQYSVKNCSGYNPAADECTGCKDGFFASGNNCLPPAAEHCHTRKSDADECETCVDGYWKDGALCKPNTAVNCLSKSTTANECAACAGGHYTEGAVCKQHDVAFCSIFSATANECTTCAPGYYVNAPDGTCKLNTSQHCAVKSGTANQCAACNAGYYADGAGLCQLVTNVTCVTLAPNSNDCATCLSTRYRDAADGTCKPLTVVDNCQTYHETADQCTVCKNGFYKSADSLSCFPNPAGILGCTTYVDLTTCTACRKTHYLASNACTELTQPPVDGCAAYSGDGICSACDAGRSLDGAECATNTETSCLTWAAKDACATCAPNKLLDAGKCVDTEISGCAVTSGAKGSETCLVCESGRYLEANECKSSATTVQDCATLSGDGVCGVCASGKTVSPDGTKCVALDKAVFGPHCASASTNTAPKCSMCGGGFLMDAAGKCSVACAASNCLVCNPDQVEKCNLCQTGYHMTPELVCQQNNQTRDSAHALRALAALLLAALAWT